MDSSRYWQPDSPKFRRPARRAPQRRTQPWKRTLMNFTLCAAASVMWGGGTELRSTYSVSGQAQCSVALVPQPAAASISASSGRRVTALPRKRTLQEVSRGGRQTRGGSDGSGHSGLPRVPVHGSQSSTEKNTVPLLSLARSRRESHRSSRAPSAALNLSQRRTASRLRR